MESYILELETHYGNVTEQLTKMKCTYEVLPFNTIAVDVPSDKKSDLHDIDGVKSVEVEGSW